MNKVLLITTIIALHVCTWPIRCQLLFLPTNTIATLGQRVEFECRTNLATPLRWEFAPVNSTRFEFIYFNEEITSHFSSRYKVHTPRDGHWNLVIDSADMSNAGTYRCLTTPNYHIGEREASASAELIVDDSEIFCGTNASNSGIAERDYIEIRCRPTFYYSSNWISVLECTRNNEITVNSSSNYTYKSIEVDLSYVTQLASSDNGIMFICKMNLRSRSTNTRHSKEGETQATNLVLYQHSWNYTANVLYGPRNVTIKQNGDIFEVGDRLVCLADGNPTPTFQWTETRTNQSIIDGPILIIDKAMALMQSVTIRCTASNKVAGKDKSVSYNVVFAIAATALSKTVITALIGSGVFAVVGLVALGLGVTLTVRASSKGNSTIFNSRKESDIQQQDYEMVDESIMNTGDLGNPPMNKSTSQTDDIEHISAKIITGEGYCSLKLSSADTFAEPAVYAELRQYINTCPNDD